MAVDTPCCKKCNEKKKIGKLKNKTDVKVGDKDLKDAEKHVKELD